jgi:DNA helicase-2/ATP-dependent DNA helicase PcrA
MFKILEVVNQLRKSNMNTIAIITREEEASKSVYEFLRNQDLGVHLVTSTQTEYYGGVTVTSISQVKGMEFDAVLLVDVDEENYPTNELNAKLLYVGCTRALHHLYIFYSAKLSSLINLS